MKLKLKIRRQPRLQPGNPTNKTRAKQIFAKRFRVSPNPPKGKGSFSN